MRFAFLTFLLFPLVVFAQPEPDQEGVAAALEQLVTASNSGFEDAMAYIACPLADETGEQQAVPCEASLLGHRLRVEFMASKVHALFRGGQVAMNPHYGVEEEREGVYHLLLFTEIENADFVMAAFQEIDGAYRLTNLEVESDVVSFDPPAALVEHFQDLAELVQDESVDAAGFAPFVIARGNDEDRAWKNAADPNDLSELAFAEHALNQFRDVARASGGMFEIAGYESEIESEGEWHVLHTTLAAGDDERTVSFAFLVIGDDLLLGDID